MKATAATIYELMKAELTLELLSPGKGLLAILIIHRELERFRNSVLKEAEEVARLYGAPGITMKIEQIEKGDSVSSVNHPDHYGGDTTYEAIKVIEAWGLGFHLGSALKYIARAGKKDPKKTLEDLEKAIWYIKRDMERRPPIDLGGFDKVAYTTTTGGKIEGLVVEEDENPEGPNGEHEHVFLENGRCRWSSCAATGKPTK